MLELLLPFQRFFKPGLILLLLWGSYRTVFKRDRAVGLVLYLGLVIIVDSFFNTGIYIPGLKYGSIRYSEVCAFFLLLSNPSNKYSERNNRLIIIFLFLYFLLFFFSGLRGLTLEFGLNDFRRYIIPQITAFIVSYRGFDKKEDYERFLFHFMTLLIIIGLFTFWDVFFDRWILYSPSLDTPMYGGSRRHGRFGSFFLNPNYMGGFSVLVFPVVFVRALLEKRIPHRIYCWAGVLALGFSLVETQSRGPSLGFLVSLLFFILIPVKGYPMFKNIILLGAFLFVFYLFMPGFFEHTTDRFFTIETEIDTEHESRRTVWSYTINIILDNPIFGVGLGERQYFKYMVAYGFREEFLSRPLDNAHNSYLQIAVHAGIPALLLFVLYNMILIRKGITKTIEADNKGLPFYSMGLIAGLLGFLACLIPDMFMFTQSVAPVYWVMFGMLYSLAYYRVGDNRA